MKILFIKSTSIQHLALSFEKVMERFTHHSPLTTHHLKIDVLAHPHTVESLKGFDFINRIIPYNSKGNFSPLHIFRGYVRNLRREKYDMVIVPFNNMSGSGYENVMAVAICTGARHIVTCNKIGEIERLTFKDSLSRVVKGYLYYPFAILMTVVLSMISILTIFILSLRPLIESFRGKQSDTKCHSERSEESRYRFASASPRNRFAPRNDS